MANKCPTCHSDNPVALKFCGECGTQLPPLRSQPPVLTETLQKPVRELATGFTFAGRYQVIEELGHGGMGKVYKVFDTKIKEKVALKLIKPEIASDKDTIERFSNELRLARNISQRNVCRMFDMGESEGAHFITMEYVHGEDLKSMIHMSGSLSVGMLLSVGKQVCDGLAEAHSLGVIHRDLKPQNIMIDKNGNAKIMDFGIARSIKDKGITGAGVMIGTPEYMSPEQAEAKDVDHRSDIYSLGVILYEMATSHVPFAGETALSIAMKHKGEAPKNPKQLNPNIPDDLSKVILQCLEKDKNKRFQNAAAVRGELERVEKAIPTAERVVPEIKPITSREITLKFAPRKILGPSLAFLALIIIGLIVWQLILRKEEPPSAAENPKKSIAVLPFKDLSAGQGQEALADGIPEALISALSSIERLHVSASTSSFSFKGKQEGIREIGQRLGVENLLEGSVQVAGQKLRVMVRLINIAGGFPIWSQDYNKTVDDVFAIQDDIAQSVVRALKIKLLGEEQEAIVKSYTVNREAFVLYLQGRHLWETRKKENIERAISLFDQAIKRDPGYALAYSAISDAYLVLGDNVMMPANEAFSKAKEAALKALAIDGQLAEAQISLAAVLDSYEHQFADAERTYKKGIEFKPGYALGHFWYALFLTCQGRHEEAIKEATLARELDPISAHINASIAFILIHAHKYDLALEELAKSIVLFPEHASNYEYMGFAYALKGMYDKAISAFDRCLQLNGDEMSAAHWIAYCQARSGHIAEAQKGLRKMVEFSKNNFISPTLIARVYLGLEDKEQALVWVNKALSTNDGQLNYLNTDPTFDPLRFDTRFTALLRKIGFKH